jgi:hypothetical protein
VNVIAKADEKLGREFANEFLASPLKQSEFENKLQQYAQQEQQSITAAQQIRPPGPLRALHQNMINSLELREQGLSGMSDVLAASGASAAKNQTQTVAKLTAQGQLLTSSDVVWAKLYQAPATLQLQAQGVTGVVIPSSVFIENPDLVSARSFAILLTRFGGASTGGTPSGKHGDALDLSSSVAPTIKVSTDLAFIATVENSGNFQEVNVVVKLTIDAGGTPVKLQKTIPVIQPGQRQTVTFTNLSLPTSAFGTKSTVRVDVSPVPGEINTGNNSATYTVFFTLS